MKKIYVIDEPRNKPIYDPCTGKFLYWRLAYNVNENQTELRFFKDTLFSSGYKKLCRFQSHLQVLGDKNSETGFNKKESKIISFLKHRYSRQIQCLDDIAPVDVSDIKTVMYDTEQSKRRVEDGAVIQSMKKGDVIARYVVLVTYPGDVAARTKKKVLKLKSNNVMDVYKNKDGNTVITYVWNPRDFSEPEDSLHAAEMFHSTMVSRVTRNADGK